MRKKLKSLGKPPNSKISYRREFLSNLNNRKCVGKQRSRRIQKICHFFLACILHAELNKNSLLYDILKFGEFFFWNLTPLRIFIRGVIFRVRVQGFNKHTKHNFLSDFDHQECVGKLRSRRIQKNM